MSKSRHKSSALANSNVFDYPSSSLNAFAGGSLISQTCMCPSPPLKITDTNNDLPFLVLVLKHMNDLHAGVMQMHTCNYICMHARVRGKPSMHTHAYNQLDT